MWNHINTVNLFGLLPFLFSIKRHRHNVHSCMVVIFGALYHTNNHISFCRYLDIIQCVLNGGIAFCYGVPAVKMYATIVLLLYLSNCKFFGNNKWMHLLVQITSARGLFLHESYLSKVNYHVKYLLINKY